MYNSELATAYAHRWAMSRNPRFADFSNMGGDCTSFISQCLNAGGFTMDYRTTFGWFYRSMSLRTASWSGVEFLYDYAVSNNNAAGVKGRPGGESDVKVGDVIQLSFDGRTFGHSLLVVGFSADGGDPLIATHTNDSDNRALSSYIYVNSRAILF